MEELSYKDALIEIRESYASVTDNNDIINWYNKYLSTIKYILAIDAEIISDINDESKIEFARACGIITTVKINQLIVKFEANHMHLVDN